VRITGREVYRFVALMPDWNRVRAAAASPSRIVSLCLLLALLVAGCLPGAQPATQPRRETLTVFAAASLKDLFEAMEEIYEVDHPTIDVVFNLGGSQQLAQQLVNGAPADLFASANQRQMQVAIDAGRVATESRRIFAGNRLIIVTPADNPAGIDGLAKLANPGLKLVLAAASVPAGEYSLTLLDKAAASPDFGPGFREAVLANVVSYEENVRSVLNKVVLGEADAGIVYSSDVTPDSADQVLAIPIPPEFNVEAQYPVAVIVDSDQIDAAQAFVDLLLSAEGQALLANFGFVPVESQAK